MLAELASNQAPDQIKPWLECAAWALGLALCVWEIIRRLRGPDPKPPAAELEIKHQALDVRVTKIEQRIERVGEKMVGDEWFSKMDTDVQRLNDKVDDINTDLKKMPMEILQMIRAVKEAAKE